MKDNTSISTWNSYFDLQGVTLRVSGSYFSGFEYVHVDGELVSKKLNWSFRSKHRVAIDNVNYEISIELLAVLKPQIRIQLLQDGQLLDEDFIFAREQFKQNKLANLWVSVGFGAVTGFLTYWLVKWLIGS